MEFLDIWPKLNLSFNLTMLSQANVMLIMMPIIYAKGESCFEFEVKEDKREFKSLRTMKSGVEDIP